MTEFEQHEAPEVEAVEADQVEPDQVEADDDVSPEPDAAPEPVKAWSDDDEQEARLFGWKAPSEWQGEKPPGYIDNPQEFLDRVQRSRIFKTMQDKMTDQERKLAAMNDRALERQKAEYESRMQALTARQRQAVEEADTDTWDRLERQRQQMMQQAPQQAPEQPQGEPPEVVQYKEANDWAKDPILWAEAAQIVGTAIDQRILRTNDPKEQIDFAERTMRNKYPHLFKPAQTQQTHRQRVDPGGLATGPASQRSPYDKLPSDAKGAFERFVKKGVYADTKKDREEYAREYNNA